MKDLMIIMLMVVALLFTGCSKKEQTPPEWGKGDLPKEYEESFGNSNGARLDYVQNQIIDRHNKILKVIAGRLVALEAVDPNE